uniref:DDE Tnp4 domain-containing protein n=1 Tax=Amphimedon queenslandica TaxID=400682 RepID=A0A1X7V873_AMPQE
MWNFPHCIGAVDGKHINIQAPANAGSEYYNYKGTHSLVLLAVCDAQYRFTLVDIGEAGRQSDGGDEVFPLKCNMLRPYPGRYLPEDKAIYNYRLSRARRVIENTFGILASRWRIFRQPIIAQPHRVEVYTKACIALHNYLQTTELSLYCPSGFVDGEDGSTNIVNGSWRDDGTSPGFTSVHQVSSNSYASFKSSSSDLCHSLTLLGRCLCIDYVDPREIALLLACRLIALDKCPSVRPLAVCETVKRIIAKAILFITKDDLREAAGTVQICAGQTSGIELHFILSGPAFPLTNDASASGKVSNLQNWWSALTNHGPFYGYLPNPCKTWLIMKSKYLDSANTAFRDSDIDITTSGRPLLGAAIGSADFVKSFIKDKSTLRNYREELVALAVRFGGLGLLKTTDCADNKHRASKEISRPLSDIIICKKGSTGQGNVPIFEQTEAKLSVVKKKQSLLNQQVTTIRDQLPPCLQLAMNLASEKGASG